MLGSFFLIRPKVFLVSFTIATSMWVGTGFAQDISQDISEAIEPSEFSTEKKFDFLSGSIGDSITAAMDARLPFANRGLNWSTGTRNAIMVNSHALRLRAMMPDKSVGTKNMAISGSRAPDVVEQAEKMAELRPDYVTVLVGANDVCSWNENHRDQMSDYESNMRTIINTLVASNDQIKILVSAIPNMPLLRDIGAANGCQSRWSLLNICPALLGADRTDADRAGFADRWEDANEILERVSADFPQHVRFAASISKPIFNFGHLSSLDCFHPNVSGQDFLSEMTWKDGWY